MKSLKINKRVLSFTALSLVTSLAGCQSMTHSVKNDCGIVVETDWEEVNSALFDQETGELVKTDEVEYRETTNAQGEKVYQRRYLHNTCKDLNEN